MEQNKKTEDIITVAGKTFYCEMCGCNVFRKNNESKYVCNGCGVKYIGEKSK
jgi:ribosomal protein L37AE/L43A